MDELEDNNERFKGMDSIPDPESVNGGGGGAISNENAYTLNCSDPDASNSTKTGGTYTTVGVTAPTFGATGIGVAGTLTSNGDVLVSGVAGTAGASATFGYIPADQTGAAYLSGPAINANIPLPGAPVTPGFAMGDPKTYTIGTPGFSGSYTVPIGTAICAPVNLFNAGVNAVSAGFSAGANAAGNIYNQAASYGHDAIFGSGHR